MTAAPDPFGPFRELLHALWVAEGCPPYRRMADAAGREVSHGQLGQFLTGKVPSMPWPAALIRYLGGDVDRAHETYKACAAARAGANRAVNRARPVKRQPAAEHLEYTQAGCDVWQLAHLCNSMAWFGWRVVAVVPSIPGVRVPKSVSDEDGPRFEAQLPYEVLFTRPVPDGGEEEVSGG